MTPTGETTDKEQNSKPHKYQILNDLIFIVKVSLNGSVKILGLLKICFCKSQHNTVPC